MKTAFNASCNNCGLQKVCFPTGLVKADIDLLDDIVERKTPFKKNQHLYHMGDVFTSIYAIRAGCVKVYSYSDKGEETIHGFYLPGDTVGFDGLIDERYRYHAMALDSTSVCELPFDDLNALAIQVPSLNKQIMNVMSKKIEESSLHSELLMKKNAEQRLAHFIWSMAERFKNRGYVHDQFQLALLHRDVALYLSLTPETVSRILAKFQQQNILSWKKKQVVIFDEKALIKIADIPLHEHIKQRLEMA